MKELVKILETIGANHEIVEITSGWAVCIYDGDLELSMMFDRDGNYKGLLNG